MAGLTRLSRVTTFLVIFIGFTHGFSLRNVFIDELINTLEQQKIEAQPPRPQEVIGWPKFKNVKLGQVSGVAVNNVGQPVIFHRADRIWDLKSFDVENRLNDIEAGPITEDTVLTLDQNDGHVLKSWGHDLFYMPHGITIDKEGNTWLTDVGLHQVFKFSLDSSRPSLVLGRRFEPGSGKFHFCKPTSVAVASSGEIFVADGYCNSRILKFDQDGRLLRVFPNRYEFLSLEVPHSLALLEEKDLLCVGDRDNMRVACLCANLQRAPCSKTPFTIQQPDMGRVFAIAPYGNYLYAVNGPTSSFIPLQGFVLNPIEETVIDHWRPEKSAFFNPHSIAISPDRSALYVSEIGPNKVWKFSLRNITKSSY